MFYQCNMTFRKFFKSMNFSTNREATGLNRHPPVVTGHAKSTQRIASARNSLQFCYRSLHIHIVNNITVLIFANYFQRIKINKRTNRFVYRNDSDTDMHILCMMLHIRHLYIYQLLITKLKFLENNIFSFSKLTYDYSIIS